MIIGSRLGMMSGAAAPDATVDFIRTKVNSTNQTTITDSNVPIGDADANRWVVFVVHAGSNGNSVTDMTATIGGISATRILWRPSVAGLYGAGAMFIANVPTGTTATCTATSTGNMQYSGGATYVLNNLLSGTPVDSFIDSQENTGTLSGTINVSAGGAVIADAGGWTNTSTTCSWSGTAGLTEQYDANLSGTNDLRCSGAIGTFASDDTGLGVTSVMTANYLNNAPGDMPVASFR